MKKFIVPVLCIAFATAAALVHIYIYRETFEGQRQVVAYKVIDAMSDAFYKETLSRFSLEEASDDDVMTMGLLLLSERELHKEDDSGDINPGNIIAAHINSLYPPDIDSFVPGYEKRLRQELAQRDVLGDYRLSAREKYDDSIMLDINMEGTLWLSLAIDMNDIVRKDMTGPFMVTLISILLLVLLVAITHIAIRSKNRLMHYEDDMISFVDHDMKRPLSVVCASGEALSQIPTENEVARKFVSMNLSASRELSDIVSHFADLAKNNIPVSQFNLRWLDIAEIADSVIYEFSAQYPEAVITNNMDRNLKLYTELRHLRAVLRCLLDNAIKYSVGTPRVELEAGIVEKGTFSMSVIDHGVGIAESERKKIFKKYYRSPQTSSKISGGGIGLYNVLQIAKAYKKKVIITDTPGGGTTITIVGPTLPQEINRA